VVAGETADELLERTIKYNQAATLGWKDYVLKAVGFREYFLGPHRITDFEFIQVELHDICAAPMLAL